MIEYKTKPKNWVSLVTGNKYSYHEYTNHGYGNAKEGRKDLPKEEYPYTLEYEEPKMPLWMK